MYFRFASALALVILISFGGVAIEKQCLDLRRAVSRQHYRQEALRDLYARTRLRTQQLGAPVRLFDALESGRIQLARPDDGSDLSTPRLPLLAWQRAGQAKR